MCEPIRISVTDAAEGIDLARALAVRGLAAHVVLRGAPQVEIDSRREETASVVADLFPALEEWSEDRGRGPVPVCVGAEGYTLGVGESIAV